MIVREATAGDAGSIVDLVGVVADADRLWLPEVDSATRASRARWLTQKSVDVGWVATTFDGEVAGYLAAINHVGAWGETRRVLEGLNVDRGRWWELCRGMVHPEYWGEGVMGTLIEVAVRTVVLSEGEPWLTCVKGSYAHRRWVKSGFMDAAQVVFPVDVDWRPGVLMVRRIL